VKNYKHEISLEKMVISSYLFVSAQECLAVGAVVI
jgi:hypothetical protein